MIAQLVNLLMEPDACENKKQDIVTIHDLYHDMQTADFSLNEFYQAIDMGYMYKEGFAKIDCKISCFTEEWDSILMWSYYANNHKGVCIEYDLSLLDPSIPLNQEILKSISPVHYSLTRTDHLNGYDDEGYLNLLLSKASVWSHEHEWRIICETTEDFLPFDCINSIYLGALNNLSSQKEAELIRIANSYAHSGIKRCLLDPDRYQINAVESEVDLWSRFFSQSLTQG